MTARTIVLLLAGLAIVGCSEPVDAGDEPDRPAQETTVPTHGESAPIVASWASQSPPVELEDGWIIRDCEGDALLLCVDHNGAIAGTVSLDSFPLSAPMAAATDSRELADALQEFAETRFAGVRDDRLAGCGDDYKFFPDDVVAVEVGTQPGVRYGFRGMRSGTLEEHVTSYATVAAGQLWIVTDEAAAEGACMDDAELDLFDPRALDEFLPFLDRVVAGTPLPAAGQRVEDSTIVGVDGGLDGGLVYVVVGAEKYRIHQPRPMTREDVRREQLEPGQAITHVRRADSVTGSYFAIVPPHAPNAELHLIVNGRIHRVIVQAVERAAVSGIPDADRPHLEDIEPA